MYEGRSANPPLEFQEIADKLGTKSRSAAVGRWWRDHNLSSTPTKSGKPRS